MLNRLLLAALLVALPLTAAGLDFASPDKAVANITTGWDPSTDAGVQAIPDRDDSSARFLVLSGPNNSTLTGDAGGAGVTYVKVTFDAEAPTDPIRIALDIDLRHRRHHHVRQQVRQRADGPRRPPAEFVECGPL